MKLFTLMIAFAAAALMLPLLTVAETVDPLLGAPFALRERPFFGETNAPVVVIEARSFRCQHCRQFQNSIFPTLKAEHIDTGKLRWVMLDLPEDPEKDESRFTAYARAGLRSGQYAAVEEILVENGRKPAYRLDSLLRSRDSVDFPALEAALDSAALQAELAADLAEGQQLGLKTLPTFILRKRQPDGTFLEARIDGVGDLAYFRHVLDAALKTEGAQ